MAKTLVQIRQQIRQLEKEAESVRAKEVAGVVARIKEAIAFYGLGVKDLFGTTGKRAGRPDGTGGAAVAKAPKKTKKAAPPRYRDPAGTGTWTGHGKRPGWFVRAIEAGAKAEDMAIKP